MEQHIRLTGKIRIDIVTKYGQFVLYDEISEDAGAYQVYAVKDPINAPTLFVFQGLTENEEPTLYGKPNPLYRTIIYVPAEDLEQITVRETS